MYLASSATLCFQYVKYIPYYNGFVSVFFGTMVFTYFWVSINALLMKMVTLNGHLIIIFIGIPLISIVVRNFR